MAGVVVVKVCTFFFAAYLQIQLPSTHFIAQGVIGSIGSRFRACRLPSRILIRPEDRQEFLQKIVIIFKLRVCFDFARRPIRIEEPAF